MPESWDHPRGCGGTDPGRCHPQGGGGPSPRVRGNPPKASITLLAGGTIPAGAGEPLRAPRADRRSRDHPRGCGGTSCRISRPPTDRGPSPRVRGNRAPLNVNSPVRGTIPAGAGEPVPWIAPCCGWGDHPRGCGGTSLYWSKSDAWWGPSPRVRGNPMPGWASPSLQGTIPAGAGEPGPEWANRRTGGDHPRGCGGTGERRLQQRRREGPSPRVRGNLAACRSTSGLLGTIPAGAGEPSAVSPAAWAIRDHPRGCGGTALFFALDYNICGPSPRVRGNLPAGRSRPGPGGTIPAGAGEPVNPNGRASSPRDHPRGCGGTAEVVSALSPNMGPSPRVRGNRSGRRWHLCGVGTIPAGAGEPAAVRPGGGRDGDHPRGCGGTRPFTARLASCKGPSPRVRGNPLRADRTATLRGTIPAGAGEPTRHNGSAPYTGDHPRGCGGTNGIEVTIRSTEGPSPRVRGNR